MTKKVSELIGAELDCWVARAAKLDVTAMHCGLIKGHPEEMPRDRWFVRLNDGLEYYDFAPSTRWDQAGPLIDKHRITIQNMGEVWLARATDIGGQQWGQTALIAAMRALVCSVYDETVPEETAP